MSREILFKAKRVNWRELPKEKWWVEGYYVHFEKNRNSCMYYIHKGAPLVTDIDPETVCQYTGLTHKNGRKIFEGDILENEYGCRGIVKWECCGFVLEWISCNASRDLYVWCDSAKSIGNIFDNPKLLEGGTK